MTVTIRLGVVLLLIAPLQAQSPPAVAAFVWDQNAPDLATARAYTYRLYVDAATTGTALSNVTCTALTATPPVATCSGSVPALTPGPHDVQLTAGNAAGESQKTSPPLKVNLVMTPATPTNFRTAPSAARPARGRR